MRCWYIILKSYIVYVFDAWSMLVYCKRYIHIYGTCENMLKEISDVLLWGGVRLKYKVFYEPVRITVYKFGTSLK